MMERSNFIRQECEGVPAGDLAKLEEEVAIHGEVAFVSSSVSVVVRG